MDNISDVSVTAMSSSNFVSPFSVMYSQDGKKKRWDCVKSHDSVVILIHNIDRDVFVCVKQFRPAVYINVARRLGQSGDDIDSSQVGGELGVTHELCAGIVDKDCSTLDIARGEVLEECGYDVPPDAFTVITTARSGVGISGSQQTMYYARVTDEMRTGKGGGSPEEGERIEVVEVPVQSSIEFALDQSLEKPIGMTCGIMWYHLCGPGKQKR